MNYVLFEDHVGWVITTEAQFEELRDVYRALAAKTWREFLAMLPATVRDRMLRDHAEHFGGESPPADGSEDLDRLGSDSPFDPSQVPGFDEGDFPVWPAEDSSVTDATCRQAYERFGQRQSGFVHTFHHVLSERIPALRDWIRAAGHALEVRPHPGQGGCGSGRAE